MSQRFLVTGGTGFIGAALVRRLLAAGHAVRVLDDQSRGHPRRLNGVLDDIDLVSADVRDRDAVTNAARGMDTIVHLAAVNGTEFFYTKPELVLDVAVRGILAVVDACRANGIGSLVVASSSEVYQTPPMVPTPETVPISIPDITNPRYSYGGGKIATELVALNYGRTAFERVVVFRPHNVYGPDMGWEHVLPQLTIRVADLDRATPQGVLELPMQGDGSQTRAFVHIDDFIDGLMTVIDAGRHLEIYHIGNPEERTIGEVALAVAACFGRQVRLVHLSLPAGGTPRRSPDITKLAALGFRPKIALSAGLPSLVSWYRDNLHLRPRS